MKTITKHEYSYKTIKQQANTLTPIDIYRLLPGRKKFLLESTFQHKKKGKFSFIGSNPFEEIIGNGHTTTIINHDKMAERLTLQAQALDYMKEHFPRFELDFPFPFYGGAVGYIGYDSIRMYENIGETLTDELNMPDIHFMVYKDVIVFDHSDHSLYLIVIDHNNQEEHLLADRLQNLQATLKKPIEPITEATSNVNFQPEMTEEKFKENVQIAKQHIQQGDVFQVVLSQRLTAKMDVDPLLFYQKLREANPSPYMFYIDFETYLLLGASPESLVQTVGQEVVTNPIAGTRVRGKTKAEDDALVEELLQDEKEIAEHRMLVDLSRNDLGRVCQIGSITIPTYMTIEKYQHVMHIVSEVKGILRQDLTSLDALIACLPAGTVSGAPKIRAMQLINELEDKKRGVYGGGIGFINFNHDLNMALAIRSLIVKNKQAFLQAGAGIVYESIPELEYLETLNKAKSIMEVQRDDSISG